MMCIACQEIQDQWYHHTNFIPVNFLILFSTFYYAGDCVNQATVKEESKEPFH